MQTECCPACLRPMTVTTGNEPIVQSHRCRPLISGRFRRRKRASLLSVLTGRPGR